MCTHCQPKPLLFKSLDDYISGKLKWAFCVGKCTDGAAAMTGRLSGLTTRIKEVAPECESTPAVGNPRLRSLMRLFHPYNAALIGLGK